MIVFMGVFPSNMDPTANIFSYNLVKAFSSQGYDVCIFGETPWWPWFLKDKHYNDPVILKKNEFTIYRPRHFRLPGYRSMQYSSFTMLISYLPYLIKINRQKKISGVFSFGLFPYLQLSSYIGRIFNVPTVCSGLGWDLHQAVSIKWMKKIALKNIKSTTLVTVQSKSNLEFLRTNGFSSENINIYRRGIDLSHLSNNYTSKIQYREKLCLPKDSKILLYAGRMSKTKGIFDILEAHSIIEKTRSVEDIFLVFIGCKRNNSGDLTHEIENKIEKEKISNVLLLDALPRDRVITYMIAADLFVFPSYHTEGMPNVILEAASVGLPIITAESPVMKEFTENGVLASMVNRESPGELAKKIIDLLSQYKLAMKKAEKAREVVLKNYNISKNITQVAHIFNSKA